MELHVVQSQGDLTFCLIPVEQFDDHELIDLGKCFSEHESSEFCDECLAEMEFAGVA